MPVKGESYFSTTDHIKVGKEEISDGRKTRGGINDAKIEVIVDTLDDFYCCLILTSKQMGSSLTIQGNMVTGTVLSATQFRDFLCVLYNFTPPKIQKKCDGSSQYFSVCHRLICRNVGLVIARHIEVH